MPTMNPFKRQNSHDSEDVLVPLSRSYSNSLADERANAAKDDENEETAEEAELAASDVLNGHTIDNLRAEIDSDGLASGDDSAYDRKSKVINKAIQDIGMGPYQWQLFILCGFGWLADNLWLQGVALTLPQLTLEFGPDSNRVRYTTCATFLGLCVGATFWGVASDIIGRRPAFNATLFLAAAFGLAVCFADSWIAVCGLYASIGVGVGGNLPVDGALFLEFLPKSSGSLLTMLSIWWPIGQLIASIIAWILIPRYSCDPSLLSCNIAPANIPCCHSAENKGWRYFTLTLGVMTTVMFICRFFFFHLYESPKYLLSRGRQAEAVATVHGIAHRNRRKTWLTEEILNEIGGYARENQDAKLSTVQIVKRQMSKFSTEKFKPLFSTWRLGLMTSLIWFCWATIGMGYPLFNAFLPQYLQNAGKNIVPTPTNIVYRNYAITSLVGVPGSIIACYTVDMQYIGRKGTIAVSTLLTGIILILFTYSSDPSYQLLMSSLEAFFQNVMYGVLYAYTPEIFPAPNRGTGSGIASLFNRLSGLLAPIVAAQTGDLHPDAPIYASGVLILLAFIAMCLFPIETRGRQIL